MCNQKKNMGLIFDFRFRQERLCLTFFSQPLSVRFSGFKVPHTLSSCIQMKNKLKVWVNWIIWRIGRVKKANQTNCWRKWRSETGPWAMGATHTAYSTPPCCLLSSTGTLIPARPSSPRTETYVFLFVPSVLQVNLYCRCRSAWNGAAWAWMRACCWCSIIGRNAIPTQSNKLTSYLLHFPQIDLYRWIYIYMK